MNTATGGLRRATFIFIFIVVLIDILAFGIIIPVLPKLVESFLANDTAAAARMYGYMTIAWGVMQFFCMPIIGMLSDRYGRRPVILLSCLGLGLDFVLMALAPNLAWLFIGRVISGATSANFSTAFAYIADVTPPEKRAASFGLLGAAFGLGFIVGPALGGVLGGFDPRLPFWASAVLALANTLYGFFVLPESLTAENRASFAWEKANPVGSLHLLRSHPELFGLACIVLFIELAHMVYPSVTVLYLGYRYGWDETAVGLMLAFVGMCSVVVQAMIIPAAVTRFGERTLLRLGLVAGVLGMTGYALALTGMQILYAVPIAALWGLAEPAAQSLMTKRVSAQEQGQLQGAISSLRSISGIVAPLVFTQVFAWFIGPSAPMPLPGAPFWLAALLLATSLALALRLVAPAETAPLTTA
ncbi:MAG TPA: TCR/Tet family MFS transporter [Candidatus Acidoferrum sp.]|nr:TCR/Tet family MFS transporter [Candidatus Acidoferrum sp.]